MTCQEVADFLMEYLNGELAQQQRAVFEEHLGVCPDCVAYLQSYEITVKAVQGTRSPTNDPQLSEIPEDLVRAILAARHRSA
ncbi:MAG: zf-HC2 domain-containing protein [Gemmataceae bacterium]|nr:zf-HC2 domain-containing protein [Gemmataceae bacterium]